MPVNLPFLILMCDDFTVLLPGDERLLDIMELNQNGVVGKQYKFLQLQISRLQFKKTFVSKMEERMQKARFLCHRTEYVNKSFLCHEPLKSSANLGDINSEHKLKFLNQTAPSRVNAEIVTHCNNLGVYHGGYVPGNQGNRLRSHDNAIIPSSTRDYLCDDDLNFSGVFRVNITVSFPVLDTTVVRDVTEEGRDSEREPSPHSTYLAEKFQTAQLQTANIIKIQGEERPGSKDEAPLSSLQQSHQLSSRGRANSGEKSTRKSCRNEECLNVSCTCKRHTIRRTKSARVPRHKPPRHTMKHSRSVVLVPGEEEEGVTLVEEGEKGVTLRVPTLRSNLRTASSKSQAPGSDSEDEVTLIADIAPAEHLAPPEHLAPAEHPAPPEHLAPPDLVTSSQDIHKLGTMLCRELRATTPAPGKAKRDNLLSPENELTQSGRLETGSRSRHTSSNCSDKPPDIGAGKRRRRAHRVPGADHYEENYSPGSSRPVSEVFSISSEYFSRATSSDHIYHDFADSDCCDSDEEYISAADHIGHRAVSELDHRPVYTPQIGDHRPVYTPQNSVHRPVHTPQTSVHRPVYTPYSESRPDQNPTSSLQNRATSTSSFHNIISTINDLEKKLGPEKHEDLRFLRKILQNDQLSALHNALKSSSDKNFTQSTPHLGNVHTVVQENALGGQSSKLAASSYNWEQIKQPEVEDEDIVTIRFTKTPEQSLGATIIGDKRTGAILIKRILEESPIAACNKIHPGDELKMINKVPVAGKSVDEVREMLGRLSQDCTLTVSSFGAYPEDREAYTAPKSRYFRAFFNYDPKKDTLNPCQDASFSFELGDILEVLNTEDELWWQAKKYGTVNVGLIPSSDQRLRYLNSRAAKASTDNLLYTRESSKKLKKKKDFLFTFGSRDHKEPLTYIEVTHVRPSKSKRRPIIITGAKNFGGSCIRKKLLRSFPEKYFLPTRHTTKTETEGHKICSKKEFSAMIKQRDLIEYTKTGGHYYGTSYESVRDLIINGKICLLDVHPQYLPVLCNGTLRPHVIFVEATTEERIKHLKQTNLEELPAPQRKLHGSDIRELRFNSERLLRRYTEYVDTIITLENLTSVVDLIDQVAERIIHHPAWMPRKWLENT